MSCKNELLKTIEQFRVNMALDNGFSPDTLHIAEDKTYYHICNGEKKCVSFEKPKNHE